MALQGCSGCDVREGEVTLYRLIATDLDGTLLMPGHRLSERTRRALRTLIERRLHLVVATGRPFEIARGLCSGITFAAPQISYNGAVVYDPVADRPLSQEFVPAQQVSSVMDFLAQARVPSVVYADGHVYLDPRIRNPEDWVPASMGTGTVLADMRQVPPDRVIKIAGEDDEATIRRIRPEAETAFGAALYVTQTSRTLLEFLHPTTSKGAALHRIAQALHINRNEIVAFGDSHNDLTMFEVAGLSVAMGNASDEVKEAADRVTADHESDGVAVVLEDLGLVGPAAEGEPSAL